MQKDDLIKFENEIAELFNAGKIRAPVHLYHGNEKKIIEIFKKIKKNNGKIPDNKISQMFKDFKL